MADRLRRRLVAGGIASGVLLAVFPVWGAATADSWRMEKQQDGIRVSSRAVAGSPIRAIRVEVDIRTPLARALALLLDVSLRPRWDETCAEASVYRQVSDTEDVIYVHNDLPWPVSDRDMVLRRTWSVASDGSRAQIRATVDDKVLPAVTGRVRVPRADAVWIVVQTAETRVQVSTEIHADPGGPIPAWLMNSLSIEAPYKALRNLRRLLESGDGAGSRAAGDPHPISQTQQAAPAR